MESGGGREGGRKEEAQRAERTKGKKRGIPVEGSSIKTT